MVSRTSHKLPLLADMLQTAVNTSEARDLPPGPKKPAGKAQLPSALPSRGFRVHIHRDKARASRGSYGTGEGMLTLSYWCFNPAAAMEQLQRLQVGPSLYERPQRCLHRAGCMLLCLCSQTRPTSLEEHGSGCPACQACPVHTTLKSWPGDLL